MRTFKIIFMLIMITLKFLELHIEILSFINVTAHTPHLPHCFSVFMGFGLRNLSFYSSLHSLLCRAVFAFSPFSFCFLREILTKFFQFLLLM